MEEIYLNPVFRRNSNDVGKKIFESAGGWRQRGGQTKTPGMRLGGRRSRELPDQRRSFLWTGAPSKGWNDWTTTAATVRGRIKMYWTGSGLRGKRQRRRLRRSIGLERGMPTTTQDANVTRVGGARGQTAVAFRGRQLQTERRQLSWAVAAASLVLITGRRDNAPMVLLLPWPTVGIVQRFSLLASIHMYAKGS